MNVLKPNKRTTVATLQSTGTSQREIARLTGVDRKTIRRLALDQTGPEPNSPTLATGIAAANSSTPATGCGVEIPPPRPPAIESGPQSLCEPHRAFIESQLRLRRNYTSIYQDLVDQFGFTGRYNSVKRFAGRLVQREPEQFDRLEFAPGEEAQVDYGEGALTRIPGSDRYHRTQTRITSIGKRIPLKLSMVGSLRFWRQSLPSAVPATAPLMQQNPRTLHRCNFAPYSAERGSIATAGSTTDF